MKRNIYRWIAGCAIAAYGAACVVSCLNATEDYFTQGESYAQEGTVLDYLSSRPEYSRFVALAAETGLDSLLSGKALLTVWAPVDSLLPDSVQELPLEEKKFIIENHISLTTIFSRNLSKLSTVATVAGKYLNVASNDTTYMVDGNPLSERDQVFENGVVHKAGGWMIPRHNLQEWLEGLGDEFSIFRDSLAAGGEMTFDKSNSPVIGLDSTGMIVYDSVWIRKNTYLNNAKLDNESARFSFFVPTDEAVERLFEDRLEYFSDIYRSDTLSQEDTSVLIHWMLNAAMHRGLVSFDKSAETSLKSINGKEIRQRYFSVRDSIEFSNGRVFVLDTCYVPMNVHYKRLDFNPYYIRKQLNSMSLTTSQFDSFYNTLNQNTSTRDNNQLTLFFQFSSNAENNYYQFKTISYDEELKICNPLPVLPGHYTVRFRLLTNDGNKTDELDIYRVRNGQLEFIGRPTGITKKWFDTASPNGKDGVVNEDFYIDGYYEPVEFRVVVAGKQTAGPNRRILIGNCALVPTDNY